MSQFNLFTWIGAAYQLGPKAQAVACMTGRRPVMHAKQAKSLRSRLFACKAGRRPALQAKLRGDAAAYRPFKGR